MGNVAHRRPLVQLEPFTPLILGLAGGATLAATGSGGAAAATFTVTLALLSVTGLLRSQQALLLLARAFGSLGTSVALIAWSGGAQSPVRYLVVLAAMLYALWLPGRLAYVYSVAGVAALVLLPLVTSTAASTDLWLLAVLTGAVGLLDGWLGRSAARLAASQATTAAFARTVQARFTAAFESARSGMAILDEQGRIVLDNEALAKFLGCDRDALAGRCLNDFMVTDSARAFVDRFSALVAGGGPDFSLEVGFELPSGRSAWAIVGGSPIRSDADAATSVFVHLEDVTARVLAERNLRASEEHFRHLFGGSPVATWQQDFTKLEAWLEQFRAKGIADLRRYLLDRPEVVRDGASRIEIKDANDAAVALLEAPDRESLLGPISVDTIEDETLGSFVEQMVAVWEGASRVQVTVQGRTLQGTAVEGILQWVAALEGEQRQLDRVIVTFTDLTQYRRAESALKRVEGRLQTVISAAPIVLFALDRFGVFTLAEGQALGRLGLVGGEPVGRSVFEMFRDSPDFVKAVRRATSGESFTTTVAVRGLYFDVRMTPIWDHGRVAGVIGVANDITERKHATDRLEQLVRTKDEFVAGVSHELRTPLTAVVGFATELRDNLADLDPAEVHAYIDLIATQSLDVADLVEDLLVAARVDMDKVAIFPEPLDVWDQIEGALSTWPEELAAEVRRAGGPAKAFADPVRVRQVLRNLFSNAQRYGGPGVEVVVEVGAEFVVIEVRDDGPGVPEAEQAHIFEPYQRAHQGAGQPMSVGLGLTVSRQLARLMDGDLTYSYADGWSVFRLYLPAVG